MAKELVPSLPEGEIISTFAGIRSENTLAPNGDFLIAHSAKAPGVIHAAIGSPGLTAAPAVAELIIQMLGEAGLALKENPAFVGTRRGWPRFSEASPEERERIISADPGYGHVLCRCEQVTAGEIAAAVQRGADTLDSVKHVTRAGMGPCQGGCCGMALMNLMAERLGLRPDQVTKKGSGSEQVFPGAR
jgi:glycerol-3-phosphate dehydrogenase